MFGLHSLRVSPKKVLAKLHDYENFCLGRKNLSPKEFKALNEELSVGAVLHIGKRRYAKGLDGKHLIWTGLDNREYDMGPVHKLEIFRNGPGFSRNPTMSLGNDLVTENETLEIPSIRKCVSIVKLNDGSVGIGPDYKTALRNASIKMHIGCSFDKANPKDAWKEHYGNA